MPIVTIETWPIEKDKKPIIMKKVTDVFVEMGIPAQAVTVLIKETPLENWATAGEQHSIKFKEMRK